MKTPFQPLLMAVICLALPALNSKFSTASAQSVQPIFSFPQSPSIPFAGLAQGPDGNFYGTTFEGGANGEGSVFEITTNSVLTTLYSFSLPTASEGTFVTNTDGVQPRGSLILGPGGNFYGTTWKGGTNGNGTVFAITTNGVLTTLVAFAGTNGANPIAGLALGLDGNLYGTTSAGGSSGNGTVFKVATNGALTLLHSFTAANLDSATGSYTNSDGEAPYAGLALGTNGNFYGAASAGGRGDTGTLFEITTNGAFTNVYSFSPENYNASGIGEPDTNADGASPTATLTLGSDGNFYGTTHGGGQSGSGTVFKVTPLGVRAIITLYTFSAGRSFIIGGSFLYTNSDGAFPYAGLTLGSNGNFYGAAAGGGSSGVGTLFEITTGGSLTTLLTFTNVNGVEPAGTLALGSDGNLYGTTEEGGSSGNGTVFEWTASSSTFGSLYSFANYNGASPWAALTLGPNGNFYGTTYTGGSNGAGIEDGADGYGTVFEIATNGALMTLVSFAGTNGANPEAPLILGPNGNFYGTTYSGGSNDVGTVFEMTPGGALTTLASFANTNGAEPEAGLILGTNGNFYGTTVNGGTDGSGAVFEVTTSGVLTLLYSFTGGNDGAEPEAGLTLGPNGNFYGTCAFGGADSYGTVFEVTNGGGFAVLHSFTDGSDGASPFAALTLGSNGNFYGTTYGDENTTYGNVFEITPNGALTNLYTFTGGNDSGDPSAALTLGPDGNFYGTTYGSVPYEGIGNPEGTVFEVTSNGAFATLVSFAGTNGENPKANLVLGPDGNFYGTTSDGGADEIGEVYRLDLPPEIIQPPASQSPAPGAQVTLSVTLFGTAPYSFQWLSNNIPIVAATNSTLSISDFAAGDAAAYSVIVSNAWGTATSAAASLAVEGTLLISGVTLSANGNVTLACQGPAGVESRVWATTNLAAPADWTPLYTNPLTPPGGAWQFTDTNTLSQQQFYRLSTP
jgi:uncharacterized repeat protein (TIGR03803 family)